MRSWTPNCNQWWNLHVTGFHEVYRSQERYATLPTSYTTVYTGMVINTYWFIGMCRGGEGEGFEQGLIVAMCVDRPALQRRRGGGIWAGSDCWNVCRSSSIAEEERGRDLSRVWLLQCVYRLWSIVEEERGRGLNRVWLLLWFPVLRCLIDCEMKFDS